jgi:hypothetical protein
MSEAWTPCGHRPPRPPIELHPTRHEPPQLIPGHIRQQLDHMQEMMRAKEGERIWGHIVDVAKGS